MLISADSSLLVDKELIFGETCCVLCFKMHRQAYDGTYHLKKFCISHGFIFCRHLWDHCVLPGLGGNTLWPESQTVKSGNIQC